jgi:hypothetical protein
MPADAAPKLDACKPAPEVCNGADDDCNGKVDDVPTAELQNDVRQCGSCDVTCLPVPANADTACRGGMCQYTCKEGFIDVDKSKVNGCECQFTGRELCDGKDNNCDGKVDEPFDLMGDADNCGACGRKCSVAGGVAGCSGGTCVLKSCLPGFADRNGNPADGCESNCVETNGGNEVCDGRDNDCDGRVDELASEANRTSDDRVVYLGPPLDVTMFAYEASRPDATATAAGTNSAGRPCSVASRLPWANVTKEEARDACKNMGPGWRLCTRDEWVAACSKRGTSTFPYGNAYQPASCNGADYRPQMPGTVATGSATLCMADQATGPSDKLWDMSGNVREWVLTSVLADGYEMRGGAYNVASFDGDAPGLKCAALVPAPAAAVRLPSVGFRCCLTGKLAAQ